MVNVTWTPGCCISKIFYDLGSAHGHATAKDQDEFDRRIRNTVPTTLNIAITNFHQEKERAYLKTQGWKSVEVAGGLELHYVSSTDLNNYLSSKAATLDKKIRTDNQAALREIERRIMAFSPENVIKGQRKPTTAGLINSIKLILPENHSIQNTILNGFHQIRNYLDRTSQRYLSMYLNAKYDITLPANLASIGYGEFNSLRNSICRRMSNNERQQAAQRN